jgi:hypothetical protein
MIKLSILINQLARSKIYSFVNCNRSGQYRHNDKLVSDIMHSFIDTGWIRRNANGTYAITMKCENVIKQVELESSGT